MPDTVTIKVEGLAALEATLRELTDEVAYKSIKRGVMAGAEVIRKEASIHAPVGPDRVYGPNNKKAGKVRRHLFQSIYKRLFNEKKGILDGLTFATVWVKVGWNKRTFYGMFEEFGTSKMAARPFMRPAYDTKKFEAVAKIVDEIKVGIRKFNK